MDIFCAHLIANLFFCQIFPTSNFCLFHKYQAPF
nr:MAG TPA: hypothetical protein [Caudoviricetes sp.]